MHEHGESSATPANVTTPADDGRYERGIATMRTLFGAGIDDALHTLAGNSPDLARHLVEFPFAEIYTRGCLDLKTREMLTVTALTVLGYAQAELKDHIRAAINVGCTKAEILEIILQMAVYAGFPAALEAVKTAAAVFSEQDNSGEQSTSQPLP